MKKQWLSLLLFSFIVGMVQAQHPPMPPAQKEITVIVDDKNGPHEQTVIEIDNGKVTINGKPAEEFKGRRRFVVGGPVHAPASRPPRSERIIIQRAPDVQRAFLGVTIQEGERGAIVDSVAKNSPAEKAGLKNGDEIISIDEKMIDRDHNLLATIKTFLPNQTVDIRFLRNNAEKKVKATLGEITEKSTFSVNDNTESFEFSMEPPLAFSMPKVPRILDDMTFEGHFNFNEKPKYGMQVEDIEDGDGAKILSVTEGSNAAKAGLQKEDVITEVGGRKIMNVDELMEELAENSEASTIAVKFTRGKELKSTSVRVPKPIRSASL